MDPKDAHILFPITSEDVALHEKGEFRYWEDGVDVANQLNLR